MERYARAFVRWRWRAGGLDIGGFIWCCGGRACWSITRRSIACIVRKSSLFAAAVGANVRLARARRLRCRRPRTNAGAIEVAFVGHNFDSTATKRLACLLRRRRQLAFIDANVGHFMGYDQMGRDEANFQ